MVKESNFSYWRKDILEVCDSGYWFWNIIYDMESDACERFDVNGYAYTLMGNSSNFGVLIRRCWSIVGLALLSIFVQFNLAAIVAVIGKEYSFGIQRFLGGKPLPFLTERVIPFISTYDGVIYGRAINIVCV